MAREQHCANAPPIPILHTASCVTIRGSRECCKRLTGTYVHSRVQWGGCACKLAAPACLRAPDKVPVHAGLHALLLACAHDSRCVTGLLDCRTQPAFNSIEKCYLDAHSRPDLLGKFDCRPQVLQFKVCLWCAPLPDRHYTVRIRPDNVGMREGRADGSLPYHHLLPLLCATHVGRQLHATDSIQQLKGTSTLVWLNGIFPLFVVDCLSKKK